METTDLQAEISNSNDNATENWNIIAPKKLISMCIGSSTSRSKSSSLENRQHVESNLIDQCNASKDIVCKNMFEVLNRKKKS